MKLILTSLLICRWCVNHVEIFFVLKFNSIANKSISSELGYAFILNNCLKRSC